VALAIAFVTFAAFGHWYMMGCEGSYTGPPNEGALRDSLPAIERALHAYVAFLSETIGPRNPPHAEALHRAEAWITERWRAQGYDVRRQPFEVEGIECANLEIEIPGRSLPSEIVLLSAQYDTWPDSPGANNNGSGMAVLLKVSEWLRGARFDRTVRLLAFTTQEPPYDNTPHMGSLRYARRCRDRGENILVALSMDAIGIYKHEPGTQKIPFPFSLFYPTRGDFLAFIANLESRPYVTTATRGFKKWSAFPIESASVPHWVKGAAWSDHGSFWRLGYPGIQITDTGAFRAASHTTKEDTIEKLDFAALARISLGIHGAVAELASAGGDAAAAGSGAGASVAADRTLLRHGLIVLLLGVLAGFPFWLAILGRGGDRAAGAWRVAHATLIATGLVLMSVGFVSPWLILSPPLRALATGSLVASGYGFAFAMIVGAAVGIRGLTPWPLGFSTLLFLGHLIGALGSVVGLGLTVWGILA
jgi:hypothetical protein